MSKTKFTNIPHAKHVAQSRANKTNVPHYIYYNKLHDKFGIRKTPQTNQYEHPFLTVTPTPTQQ
jgi:hypothetical protein